MKVPDTNGVTVGVAIANTLVRNTGKLVLSKQLSGGPGVETYNGPFEIYYECVVSRFESFVIRLMVGSRRRSRESRPGRV